MSRHRLVGCSVLVALSLVATAVPAAAAQPGPAHVPPVEAAVADPFRAPADPFGAGNRGIEYATEAGSEVRASADGVVVFAGSVAGSRHVTVRHPDGVRTSYSFLDTVAVAVGQRVAQGQPVGVTEGRLH